MCSEDDAFVSSVGIDGAVTNVSAAVEAAVVCRREVEAATDPLPPALNGRADGGLLIMSTPRKTPMSNELPIHLPAERLDSLRRARAWPHSLCRHRLYISSRTPLSWLSPHSSSLPP